jgi:hypothetical protein
MKHLLSLIAVAALVGLAFAGLGCLRPALLEEAGLDVWDWPQYQMALCAETEREQELDQSFADLFRRREAKAAVGRELIAGRVTLAEAAQRIFDLTVDPDMLRANVRKWYAAGTDEENLERFVIDFACDLLQNQSARARELRQQLLAELHGL